MTIFSIFFIPVVQIGHDLTSGPALTLLGSKLLDEGKILDATQVFRRASILFPAVPLV
jgi:hypothetical protein